MPVPFTELQGLSNRCANMLVGLGLQRAAQFGRPIAPPSSSDRKYAPDVVTKPTIAGYSA